MLLRFYLSLFGLIPNIPNKINIARGRNLALCIILQDLRQLENVYGVNAGTVIIGGCNTIVFLGSDNPDTCKFFSNLTGEATISVNTIREARGIGRAKPLNGEYQESKGEGKRYVYTEHEIRTLPNEECLIWVSGYNVLRAKKFWWFTHPGSRTKDGKDLPEEPPHKHIRAAIKYKNTEFRDAFIADDMEAMYEEEQEPTISIPVPSQSRSIGDKKPPGRSKGENRTEDKKPRPEAPGGDSGQDGPKPGQEKKTESKPKEEKKEEKTVDLEDASQSAAIDEKVLEAEVVRPASAEKINIPGMITGTSLGKEKKNTKRSLNDLSNSMK